MKILLIAGHGAGDPGATKGTRKEADETRKVVANLRTLLATYATVDVYPTNKNAFADVQNGTFSIGSYDYVLEVHFNAFNNKAYGTEIYVTTSEKATTVEQRIVGNLSKYFTNRGVKRTNFSVINTIKRKGISAALLEVCFIDNDSDFSIYQKNFNDICQQIANGIITEFGLKGNGNVAPTPTPIPTPDPTPQVGTGTYKFNATVKIRTQPDTSTQTDTKLVYTKGQTVVIDRILDGNLYTWGSYIGGTSGQRRYVALRDKKQNVWYASKV